MKSLVYAIVSLFLFTLFSCKNTINDEIREIDINKFPFNLNLDVTDMEILNIPSLGITEIKVVDSLLIVSVIGNNEFWNVYTIPNKDSIGSLLNVGNGPYELSMPIPCYQSSFYKNENGDILTSLPMPDKQRMMEINLTEYLKDNKYENNCSQFDVKSDDMTIWTYCIDRNRYLQAYVHPETRQIIRSIRNISDKSDNKIDNKILESLNAKSIENLDNIQLMLTTPAIRPDGNKVAEIPGFSNLVTVYNTTGDGGIKIRYKNMSDSEPEIRQLTNQNISLFGGGYGYNDYFALIRNEIDNDRIVNQHIDFISWDGEPLGSINLGMNTIRRFDINETYGTLFCLNSETDKIIEYDISSLLNKIKTHIQ